ncbi:lysoplasmalogenase [Salinibacterium sp.]|uniref:lysoplasmalogenase n=1 Tax=Salinibacterium sp. TaxID=1915057 RepID=UPI00286AE76B|nr:lysoplasmalogenase [Salinibacterium sp.]
MSSRLGTARWWAFAPYATVGSLHLVALAIGATTVSAATKGLLMPALLLGMLVALPAVRSGIALWGGLALLFSWAGDLLLSTPGNSGFVAGLGAFLIAHVAYLVLFLREFRVRRVPRVAFALVFWWAALLVVLGPYLGTLLLPVAVYGFVLGGSTAAAFGATRTIAIGGLLFLASDTLLAFKLFWPDFALWQKDSLVMLGYILGQGLIILGTVLIARRRGLIRTAASDATPREFTR